MTDLYGMTDDDPQAQQAALIRALRGQRPGMAPTVADENERRRLAQQRALGNYALLTGDDVLGRFGQAQLDQASGSTGLRSEALRQGQARLELQAAEALRRGNQFITSLDARRGEGQIQRDFQAEQNALNRISRERAAAILAGQKSEDTTEKQTKEFGEEVVKAGAPGFLSRYDTAIRILNKHKGDLPGFGRVEGRLADEFVSEDGRRLRQSIGQLLSEYRKGQTGAGMSDSERVEYGRITGLIQTGDEKSVRQGIEALKDAMDARLRATAGGFRPEAVQKYATRVPRIAEALGLPAGAPGAPTIDLNDPPPAAPGPTAKTPAQPGGSANAPRIVSVKGLKPGELVKSLKDGETVRVPMGGGRYQTVRRKGDKLVKVKE